MQSYNSTYFHPLTRPLLDRVFELSNSDQGLDYLEARVLMVASGVFYLIEAVYNATLIVGCTIGRYTLGQIKWNNVKLIDLIDPEKKSMGINFFGHIYKTVECAFHSLYSPLFGGLFSAYLVSPDLFSQKNIEIENQISINDLNWLNSILSEDFVPDLSETFQTINTKIIKARIHSDKFRYYGLSAQDPNNKIHAILSDINLPLLELRINLLKDRQYVSQVMVGIKDNPDQKVLDECTLIISRYRQDSQNHEAMFQYIGLSSRHFRYNDMEGYTFKHRNLGYDDYWAQMNRPYLARTESKLQEINKVVLLEREFQQFGLNDLKQRLEEYQILKEVEKKGSDLMVKYQKILDEVTGLNMDSPSKFVRIAKIEKDISNLLAENEKLNKLLVDANRINELPLKKSILAKVARQHQTIFQADVFFNTAIAQKKHAANIIEAQATTILCGKALSDLIQKIESNHSFQGKLQKMAKVENTIFNAINLWERIKADPYFKFFPKATKNNCEGSLKDLRVLLNQISTTPNLNELSEKSLLHSLNKFEYQLNQLSEEHERFFQILEMSQAEVNPELSDLKIKIEENSRKFLELKVQHGILLNRFYRNPENADSQPIIEKRFDGLFLEFDIFNHQILFEKLSLLELDQKMAKFKYAKAQAKKLNEDVKLIINSSLRLNPELLLKKIKEECQPLETKLKECDELLIEMELSTRFMHKVHSELKSQREDLVQLSPSTLILQCEHTCQLHADLTQKITALNPAHFFESIAMTQIQNAPKINLGDAFAGLFEELKLSDQVIPAITDDKRIRTIHEISHRLIMSMLGYQNNANFAKVTNLFAHIALEFNRRKKLISNEKEIAKRKHLEKSYFSDLKTVLIKLGISHFHCTDRIITDAQKCYFTYVEKDKAKIEINNRASSVKNDILSQLLILRREIFDEVSDIKDDPHYAASERYLKVNLGKEFGLNFPEFLGDFRTYENYAQKDSIDQVRWSFNARYTPLSIVNFINSKIKESNSTLYTKIMSWFEKNCFIEMQDIHNEEGTELKPEAIRFFLKGIGILQ